MLISVGCESLNLVGKTHFDRGDSVGEINLSWATRSRETTHECEECSFVILFLVIASFEFSACWGAGLDDGGGDFN